MWLIQIVFSFQKQGWSEIGENYWFVPFYYMALVFITRQWNILNCDKIKKEIYEMSLFKDILDNSEESVIIVNNN